MSAEGSGALSDVRVLEVAEGISGPFCARLFADLGADVTKVEPPRTGDRSRRTGPFLGDMPGQENSALFMYLNTNKRSITLDLSQPTGRDIFRRLCQQADVIVQDTPPDVFSSPGSDLSYERLRTENAHLVMISVSPFGQAGPHARWKSYELTTFQASVKGYLTPEAVADPKAERPLKAGGHLGAFLAGATAAAMGMPFVFQAKVTGRGTHVDVSGQEAVLTTAVAPIMAWFYAQRVPKRSENLSSIGAAIGLIRCRDGYVQLTIMEDYQWESFVQLMGEPGWTADERFATSAGRGSNWPTLQRYIEEWATQYTKDDVATRAQQHRVPCLPVNTAQDALASDQLASRQFFVDVPHPSGQLRLPRPPFIAPSTPCPSRERAPLLGEHNREVYCDQLGFTREELVKLWEAGVI